MTFYAVIREAFASDIGRDSDYNKVFCGFTQSLQEDTGLISLVL
jgi:hypothetical protein